MSNNPLVGLIFFADFAASDLVTKTRTNALSWR